MSDPVFLKHLVRVLASLALSAVFLGLAVRGVDSGEVWIALKAAHLGYLAPMIFGSVASLYFRALRWGVLTRPLGPIPVDSLFSATAMGFAANMLLPLRAGEVLRPWFLARKEGIGFAALLATIALERLFDMAILLLFFAIATLSLPLPEEWKVYGWFFVLVFGVLLVSLVGLQRAPGFFLDLAARCLRPLPERISQRLLAIARQFADGLRSLESGSAVLLALAHSIAVWVTIGMSFGFGLPALDLPVPLLRGALATTTFVAIAVAIPGGPGFIGMFQIGCVVALEVYGVARSPAFSYSVFVHVVQFAATVAVGLYFFLRENLSWSDIRAAQAGR